MELSVREDPTLDDVHVRIDCPRIDGRVRRIVEAAEMEDRKLAGVADGYLCMVGVAEVLYAETVDSRTFLYTEGKVVESALSLAELEAGLQGTEFVRASRQLLVNLAHVRGLRPYLNARLELVLDNGEHVVASRQYAPGIKHRIGL